MRFELEIPDPARIRVGKEDYVTLPASTALHRLHRDQFGSVQFNATDRGDTRFAPIRDGAGSIIPTAYGAQSFECAVAEVILRCPDTPPLDPSTGLPTFIVVYPSDYASHLHSVVQTQVDLTLVDVTTAGQRKLGIHRNALLAGPRSTYPATRAWAEQIYAACPSAQGLSYSSLQFGPQFAVVLFGDRLPANALTPVSSRRVADLPCHQDIEQLAYALSIDYSDV